MRTAAAFGTASASDRQSSATTVATGHDAAELKAQSAPQLPPSAISLRLKQLIAHGSESCSPQRKGYVAEAFVSATVRQQRAVRAFARRHPTTADRARPEQGRSAQIAVAQPSGRSVALQSARQRE